MTRRPEDWQRLRATFEEASSMEHEARLAFVHDSLSDAPELAARVEEMLRIDEEPDDELFLEPPASARLLDQATLVRFEGRRVGSFTLRRLIAAGGMGAVYEAEQDEPARRVAIKMLRSELANDEARRRFRYEADLLARLTHPGIARIYEAGVLVERGEHIDLETPWFAMELVVGGRAITQFARESQLSTRERLQLLRTVCDAVHHGHQRGVVHRDLKPANILIDEGGNPKVIDFGVAKATDGTLQNDLTREGSIVGTLLYMSPEQVSGVADEIDWRCDVYALGIVLYELLCDAPPFDISGLSLADAGNLLTEQAVPAPSKKSDCDRELDWIVARALAKEKERRFQSVSELSEDIRRYLEHVPLVAGPPSTAYALRKFIRRHRVGVGAALLVLAAISAGVVGIATGLVRAKRAEAQAILDRGIAEDAERQAKVDRELAIEAERRAKEDRALAVEAERDAREERNVALDEADKATAVVDFLVDVLSSPDPGRDGRKVLVIDVLEEAASTYEERFIERPDVSARLASAIGVVYHGLGVNDLALVELESALEVLRPENEEPTADLARVLREIAVVRMDMGDLEGAGVVLSESLEIQDSLESLDSEEPYVLQAHLGRLRLESNDPLAAENLLAPALEGLKRTVGEEHSATLLTKNTLAGVYHLVDRLDEAEALYVEALEGMTEQFGVDNPNVMTLRSNLAMLYHALGKTERALPLLRELLEVRRQVLGDDHPETLGTLSNLGGLLQLSGRPDEAAPLYEEALEAMSRQLPETHRAFQALLGNLAALELERQNYPRATELNARLYEIRRTSLGERHLNTLSSLFAFARSIRLSQDFESGLELATRGYDVIAEITERGHSFRYYFDTELILDLVGLKRFEEAEALVERTQRDFDEARSTAPRLSAPYETFATLYEQMGRPETAAQYWQAHLESAAENDE